LLRRLAIPSNVPNLVLSASVGVVGTGLIYVFAAERALRKAGVVKVAVYASIPWHSLMLRALVVLAFAFAVPHIDPSTNKFTVFWVLCILDSIIVICSPIARLHANGIVVFRRRFLPWSTITLESKCQPERTIVRVVSKRALLPLYLIIPPDKRETFEAVLRQETVLT